MITRDGYLTRVIKGCYATINTRISPIKLNMQVIKGINNEEIKSID